MEAPKPPASPEQVADLIQRRQTFKVLGDVESSEPIQRNDSAINDAKVIESIRTAGWAPFHYDRNVNGIAEPWRAYVLWNQDCRRIATNFHNWFDGVKPSNKLPAMLSACGALVLVTWLPQFKSGSVATENDSEVVNLEKQAQIDEEHLAATSAMVQNLLLLLTAHGMGTYWSSGGQFRLPAAFSRLGIPSSERLLAAVFVEYPDTTQQSLQRLPGKHRNNRCPNMSWIRQIALPPENAPGTLE